MNQNIVEIRYWHLFDVAFKSVQGGISSKKIKKTYPLCNKAEGQRFYMLRIYVKV